MKDSPSTTGSSHPVAIAPAPPSVVESDVEHMSYACVTCTKRKVKCDKLLPVCSTCKKARLQCEYNEGPAPRKRKRKPPPDADVQERLDRAEAVLRQNNLLAEYQNSTNQDAHSPEMPSLSSPFYTQKGILDGTKPGRLLGEHGKTRYISSGLWQNLGDHNYHPSSDEEDEGDEESTVPLYPTFSGDPASAAFLGLAAPAANLLSSHPVYDTAMEFWRVYVENIDPIVKLVHVPSWGSTLQRAASNPSTVSKATEALLFAIYHFAVVVMTPEDIQKRFAVPKSKLVKMYHDAARQALLNASFLRTTDLTVLQAYLLFLLSVRATYDPHTFWILTGIAVRIGQRMGLHRDGEELGLKPFDVQMRRRVFWQILPLDGMAGQLCGTGISVVPDSFNTKQPTNVDDSDIWPDMTEPPQARIGATDMIFCLARTEFGRFLQTKREPPWVMFGSETRVFQIEHINAWDKQLDELEVEFETKYLRYCDFANPLHNLVALMARTASNAGRLRVRLSRARMIGSTMPEDERAELWKLAVKILEYDIAAQQNFNLGRFFWHLQSFFQWDPMIWILNEIWRDPLRYKDERIWEKIEKVYENHPKMLTQKRALHIAVGDLTLKAWDAHQATRAQGQPAQWEPPYIRSLRAFTSKANSSRGSSSVQPSPVAYNPFDPIPNDMNDLGPFTTDHGTWNANDIASSINRMGDLTAESIDWAFWDQLVRDPTGMTVN